MKLSTDAQTFMKNLLLNPWLTVGEDGEMALAQASEVKVLKPAPIPLTCVDGLALAGEETDEGASSRVPLLFAISVRSAA